MGFTNEDLQKMFDTVKSINDLNELEYEYLKTLKELHSVFVNDVSIKLTCCQCGEVISEDEFERFKNAQVVTCRKENIRLDDYWCDECDGTVFDVEVEIEIVSDAEDLDE
jgi:hypothetical protein